MQSFFGLFVVDLESGKELEIGDFLDDLGLDLGLALMMQLVEVQWVVHDVVEV
jgi:hypothetical protein